MKHAKRHTPPLPAPFLLVGLGMMLSVTAGWTKSRLADQDVLPSQGADRSINHDSTSAASAGHANALTGHTAGAERNTTKQQGQQDNDDKTKKAEKKPIPLPPKQKQPEPGPGGVLLSTHTLQGLVQVRSWKHLRDAQIVKQDQDFSCGAASLATLLNGFYGQNLTEEELLKAMDKGDAQASFDDMARALPRFGFRAQGFAASWDQLTRLKMPVVVYVKYRKDDHFSVLRGISGNTVWLADPSLGNRTFSRQQFLEMWQTRQDKDAPALAGKFLAVLPASKDISAMASYFLKTPDRQSTHAVEQLAFQNRP